MVNLSQQHSWIEKQKKNRTVKSKLTSKLTSAVTEINNCQKTTNMYSDIEKLFFSSMLFLHVTLL